jgi:hypothetical protein
MHRQRVFLVLDNLWDAQIEEARKYLRAGYHDGSMVLVTSRSKEVLCKRLQIEEHHCMQMPNLEDDGAIDVFLQYAGISRSSIKNNEWSIITECVKKCQFLDPKKHEFGTNGSCSYLPLALKALGSQLGSNGCNILEWEETLKKVGKPNKFNILREKEENHPVFRVLRIGYDALCEKDQHIFLDLALVWICKWRCPRDKLRLKWDWLCCIHKNSLHTEADMKAIVSPSYSLLKIL